MCFYKDVVNYDVFHKIAKEDIVCYKVMTISKIGNDGAIWVKSLNVLESGVIHSYIHLPNIVGLNEHYVGKSVTVKCRIPKGTPYWANHRDGVYASTKLILDGIVNSN